MFNLAPCEPASCSPQHSLHFSAAPVSVQVEVTGRVKTTAKTVENGIPGRSNFIPPDPAGQQANARGAGFRAAAHIGYAATPNELLIVQDANLMAGVERLKPMRNSQLAVGPPAGMKKPAAPVAQLKSWR
jgi:hypothetical protein